MPDIDNFLASVDWANLATRMTAYAVARLELFGLPVADAEDIAQESLARLFDAEYKTWCPTTPSLDALKRHLASVINGIVINRSRLRTRRTEPEEFTDTCPSDSAADDGQALEDLEYAILDELDGDEDACAVLDCFTKGVAKAAEQAVDLSWKPTRVYEARRRVREAAKRRK